MVNNFMENVATVFVVMAAAVAGEQGILATGITIPPMLAAIGDNIVVLGIAGLAGAMWLSMTNPEPDFKKRISRSAAGVIAAIFLGGIVASIIVSVLVAFGVNETSIEGYAFLGAGFFTSIGGENFVRKMQTKVLGKSEVGE